MGVWVRRRYAAMALGLIPLIPGWISAFLTYPEAPARRLFIIGGLTTGTTIVLGLVVWEVSRRVAWPQWRGRERLRFFAIHALAALAFTAAWVCLQYALNPYRVGSLLAAMDMSPALPWQVAAAFWIYVALATIAGISAGWARETERAARPTAAARPSLEHLSIRYGTRTIVVPVGRIERLEGCDDHVAVYAEGKRLLASQRLSRLAEQLEGQRFVRVHRSHVVNLDFVQAFETHGDRATIVMQGGERVSASRAGTRVLRGAAGHRGSRAVEQ